MRWMVSLLAACSLETVEHEDEVAGELSSVPGQFGGAFQLGDAGCASCLVPNPLTGGCSCPSGFFQRAGGRVLADCGAGGAVVGTTITYCTNVPGGYSTPPPLTMWQRDDDGGSGCTTPNYLTAACSCPAGTITDVYRTVRPTPSGGIGATLGLCQYVANFGEAAFAGTYHDEDGLEGCVPSPYTSRCDCPALSSKQALRAVYDPPGGFAGATIGVCSPCRRRTCAELGVTSGTVSDGCGGALDCGSTCPTTCAQIGATCGLIDNGCGTILDCGPVGAGCVVPATCPAGSAPSDLRAESRTPSSAAPGSRVRASVTFANCSGSTWMPATSAGAPTGYKLGFNAPQDRALWGDGRLLLPAAVPHGRAVTIPIDVGAPPLLGQQRFAWRVVNEGTAWIGESSTERIVDVRVSGARPVALCPGVFASPDASADASAALQTCIDATPDYGTLLLPTGFFRIDDRVTVRRPITIAAATTSSASCLHPNGNCPVLIAGPDAAIPHGFVFFEGHDIAIHRIVIDGNRAVRSRRAAGDACFGGSGATGVNASWICTSCSMTESASVRGVCGASISFDGTGARFLNNAFVDNGTSLYKNLWSDGLGLGHVPNAHVRGNFFFDNTDAALIAGRGENAVFELNYFLQREKLVFTAFMLTNFNGVENGDFTGGYFRNQTIDCGSRLCDFGIQLGHHPAQSGSPNIFGGRVYGNAIYNARQGLGVEGGGTAAVPMTVYGNTIAGTAAYGNFSCGDRETSAINISPDSAVDRAGDTTPATARIWHDCI